MKKFLYIISAALLALTACTQELEQPADLSSKFPEGKVLVNVEVEFPGMDGADTRAMAQDPTIESLYVAVFGSEGSFQNWIPATFDKIVGYQDHTTTAKYKVYLPITDKKRHLHFIANPPKDKDGKVIKPVFGDEDEVINAMVKTKGSTGEPEDAYWQKIELDHIGSSSTSPTAEGYFEPDQDTQDKLAQVCLVRNYAKIKVSVKDNEPYKILDYRLMNVPKKGSVAPWNTGTQEYEPVYMNILSYAESGKPGDFYETLMKKYLGYMPDADALDTTPSTVVTVNDNGDYGAFMYERTMFTRASKEGSQTCFIAHIQFTQDVPIDDGQTIKRDTEYYYKIAVVGPDGEYIPILRNIQYSIEISGIKEKGHPVTETELENASEWDFAGNINTGLEISTLNELSNGKSMIRVNQTEYTSNGVVDQTTKKVPSYTIYWQYFPTSATATGTPVVKVGEVDASGSMEAYDVSLMMYDITKESAIDGSLDDLVLDDATLSDGTWGTIEVPIAQRGKDTKTSVIRISGRYGSGRRIFREVIINVLPETEFLNKQEQSTDATIKGTYVEADVIDGLNKVVNVHFQIPEGLGASMFPLNVTIEAKNNNLYSTSEDLPVETGTSYWSDKNNTFYFIRQIPLSEYRRIENGAYVYKQDYTCTLYTSKESGNSTDIVLADEKGFFKPCELSLATLYADKYEQTVSCTATSATVNITSSKLSWEITNLSGGLTDVSPSSYTASGTTEVTTPVEFKFNENTSTTEAKEYTADLVGKMDGKVVVTKPIKITQKLRNKKTATATATFTYENFSTSKLTDTDGDITVSFTRINSTNYSAIQIDRNQSSTITFTPVSSSEHMNVTVTGITISFYNNYYASSISGPFTGGTSNNNRNATYNGGNTTSPVSTTLTARNVYGGSLITSIVVNYTYEYYE